MITQNQTPGNDNQLIWLLQITLDTITYYFTNWHTDITLSGNVYKHGVIESNTLSVTGRELSFSGNKYIGSIGALSFNLSKRSGFSLDDIQPTANKPYTSNRTVSLGYIWQGATLESEITFQDMYFIQEIKGDPNRLSFSCIDKCELDFINIPFYTVQKDYDNGISYYPYAPEKSYGAVIPILYGHFNDLRPDLEYMKLVPTVCVDKRRLEFKVASHKCYATGGGQVDILGNNADAFKYQSEANTYTYLNASGVQFKNTIGGHTISLLSTTAPIHGTIYLQLKKAGQHSAFPEINIPTIDTQNLYTALTNQTYGGTNQLSWQLDTTLSTANLGRLRANEAADVAFCVKWETGDVYEKHIKMWVIRNDFRVDDVDESGYSDLFVDFTGYDTLENGSGELQIGKYTGWDQTRKTKRSQILPWDIEELQECEFAFRHVSTGSPANYANIKNAYIVCRNFLVLSLGVDKITLPYNKLKLNARFTRI